MAYELYASLTPVSEQLKAGMRPLEFDSMNEALDRARYLGTQGWHLYRLAGPNGFKLSEIELKELSSKRSSDT